MGHAKWLDWHLPLKLRVGLILPKASGWQIQGAIRKGEWMLGGVYGIMLLVIIRSPL